MRKTDPKMRTYAVGQPIDIGTQSHKPLDSVSTRELFQDIRKQTPKRFGACEMFYPCHCNLVRLVDPV